MVCESGVPGYFLVGGTESSLGAFFLHVCHGCLHPSVQCTCADRLGLCLRVLHQHSGGVFPPHRESDDGVYGGCDGGGESQNPATANTLAPSFRSMNDKDVIASSGGRTRKVVIYTLLR